MQQLAWFKVSEPPEGPGITSVDQSVNLLGSMAIVFMCFFQLSSWSCLIYFAKSTLDDNTSSKKTFFEFFPREG